MGTQIPVEVGTKFNKWTTISPRDGKYVLCKCECGREKKVAVRNLFKGLSKSCGCDSSKRIQALRNKDIKNQRFSKLVALYPEYHVTAGGNKIKYWKCKCDCGNETSASTHDLLSGHTKSCGKCIYNISPKVVHKRIFDAWRMMIARCENPKAQAYHNYGERGIKVCEEWHDFDVFLNWALSNGYQDELTIDRKNVNGGYCPENCRWVTDKVQGNNRRSNHFVTYNDETHTLTEWSEILNIPYSTISSRLYNGWTVKDAFEKPLKKYPRKQVS